MASGYSASYVRRCMRFRHQPLVALLFVVLVYVSARPAGPIPPLGPLLDPANGVWAVALSARFPSRATGRVPSLGDTIRVLYDTRGVPHIFARSREDATRALGYVVARDRLFQLELQTRAAEGTLTELVGPIALGADREARQLGLAWSAERAFAAMDTTSDAYRSAVAFADGVNAYIRSLRPRDYPVEYHLLGCDPMFAEPVHSLYLHRRMGYTLTYTRRIERLRERIVALVGETATDALFPLHAPIVEPVAPGGRAYPVFDSTPLPPPHARELAGAGEREPHRAAPPEERELAGADLPLSGSPALRPPAGALGSNSWAVSAARSATGHPLLAGDPHLDLTLPSIWYEVHLVVSPGPPATSTAPAVSSTSSASSARGGEDAALDAYGVTIPGLPGVVIGFNRDVAWTFTNTEIDVLDFYRETLDDTVTPPRYRLDGGWRPLEVRVEEYRDRDSDLLAVDTLYHTLRGPVLREDDGDLSIRWTVLETDSNWESFLRAMTARSVTDLVDAFGGYEAPAQNVAMADRAGNIGIYSPGWYPTRPGNGRGDIVRLGSTTTSDWTDRVPPSRVPTVLNPRQGYAASANQEPFDPIASSLYLGSDWYAPWRAMRINALLRANSAVTADDMRQFQTDPHTARAELFVPLFLRSATTYRPSSPAERVSPSPPDPLSRERERGNEGRADSLLQRTAQLLAEWDRRYTPDNRRAVLFEMAMDELEERVWDELVDPEQERRIATPSEAVLWRLTYDSRGAWWDDRRTDAVETRDDVVTASLRKALELALEHHGPPDGDGWRWENVQTTNIHHLLRIPSFSALDLPVQGGPGALNPSSGRGTFGASWRMVVELGDTVRAWTTYPGGQSGNPVSPRYDDRIPTWISGELDPAIVPRTPAEMERCPVAARLTLFPEDR
jgi:penicillin amidase